MIDLAAIEARCNAATPSPWEAHSGKTDKGTPWNEVHSPCPCCGLIATTHPIAGADDAAFIAYARTDIPALIERVRELEAERDAAVADLSTYKECGFCVHLQNQQYCYKNCQRHVDVDNFRTHPCWEWRGLKGESK
jgi:hypothetical protein